MNPSAYAILKTSAAILLSAVMFSCSGKSEYRKFTGFAQGGTYSIIVQCPAKTVIQTEIDSVLSMVDNSLSIYNPSSTVSRINRGTDMRTDPIFEDMFAESLELYRQTDGMVDPSAGPIFDFWGFGNSRDTAFMKYSIADRYIKIIELKKLTGLTGFCISDGMMTKPDSMSTLNFNALAQGYACDFMARFLESRGITNYLVEIGGEIYCKGLNRRGEEWAIGIDRPVDGSLGNGEDIQEIVRISNKGVVTSGNYRKFIMDSSSRINHSINPKTGMPVENRLLSATVIADDATTADAFATFFMTVGLDKAKQVLDERDDLEGYLIFRNEKTETGMDVFYSKGMKIQASVKDRTPNQK